VQRGSDEARSSGTKNSWLVSQAVAMRRMGAARLRLPKIQGSF
jgi:hypothetical protein